MGLRAEARIAGRFGYPVLAGGGTPGGAAAAASRLVAQGATALVSFGLAGGLDPAVRPGMVVIPATLIAGDRRLLADATLAAKFGGLSPHVMLAGAAVAADAAAKRLLHAATGAHAIDLESGSVASVASEHGLPFVIVRAICDPAERDLPAAALVALDERGVVGVWRILRSVFRQPGQFPHLLTLARDAALARRALRGLVASFDHAWQLH